MRSSQHPSDDVLQGFAEGRLDAAVAERVRLHVDSGCAQCSADLDLRRRMMSALQAARWAPVPADVLERGLSLFQPPERAPGMIRRMVAALTFDSRLQPAPVGVRDLDRNSFKLVYETTGVTVDLLCSRGDRLWKITGQVVTEVASELWWHVAVTGRAMNVETTTDGLGGFTISDLVSGVYDVLLSDWNREIGISRVELT